MAETATELFLEMERAIAACGEHRESDDPASPMRDATVEAEPGSAFKLWNPQFCIVGCKQIDLRWACANVLHFFAETEEGDVLRQYNVQAARFLDRRGYLRGAYGPIVLHQVERCLSLLQEHPSTRRAVATMGELPPELDINRPPCWTSLHFLTVRGKLDMVVYQRSLNLNGVMPYDCILLCTLLRYAAWRIGVPHGVLRWAIGSLHNRVGPPYAKHEANRYAELPFDMEMLQDPELCMLALQEPEGIVDSWLRSILCFPGRYPNK